MAHFAELNDQNIVTQVVVIANDALLDENGVEQESLGIDECVRLIGPGRWIQTSYNNNIRHRYASVGHLYRDDLDVFVRPQPYASWVLDDDYEWVAPVEVPLDREDYVWDETTTSWVIPDSALPEDQQTDIEVLP